MSISNNQIKFNRNDGLGVKQKPVSEIERPITSYRTPITSDNKTSLIQQMQKMHLSFDEINPNVGIDSIPDLSGEEKTKTGLSLKKKTIRRVDEIGELFGTKNRSSTIDYIVQFYYYALRERMKTKVQEKEENDV